MIYLEMSRDPVHGGGTWAFGNCIWAPNAKQDGSQWPFWSKILEIREGDLILHLRGVTPNAEFIGFSIASGEGFETRKRPPEPKEWAFAETFLRADLRDFTAFHKPINLTEVFSLRRTELETYFDNNKARHFRRRNIFYVRQSGRLQCLNGAYLSEIDDELLAALFGDPDELKNRSNLHPLVSVETGFQIAEIHARIGQTAFAKQIKELYRNTCCFPGCSIADSRFLVASHIARWSDNENLRGNLGNGLCLCVMHDKAFELGIYTLDEELRVYVNPRERSDRSAVVKELMQYHGEQIRVAMVPPLTDALLEHWIRVDIDPTQKKTMAAGI
jgi:hypothetical protein